MNETIKRELQIFETDFSAIINNKFDKYIEKFLFRKSKRLRPLLGILYTKALGKEITKSHKYLFTATELIHNASLIHDDIIDTAQIRRGAKSINAEFGNALAVVSGDILLAQAMDLITDIENKNVQKLCASNMIKTCQGEISQYFTLYHKPTIEEYIEKSRKKTALLYEISISGGVMLNGNEEEFEKSRKFANNFGIAFQIKNDLENYMTNQEDYKQGIYTAPAIYEGDEAIEKTICLINNYLDEAQKIIKELPKNEYSDSINEITDKMRN